MFGGYELHECFYYTWTSTDILFSDKTLVPMFYFDSKTAKPIVTL